MPPRPLLLLTALGLLLAFPSRASAQAADEATTLRVRLLEGHQVRAIEVTSEGGTLALFADNDAPVARLEAGTTARVSLQDGAFALEGFDVPVQAEALRVEPLGEARIRLRALGGTDVLPARLYEGAVAISPDPEAPSTLLVINEVGLETYVAGVLAQAYGADEPGAGVSEAAKAMAVAIRTAALFARDQSAGLYDFGDDLSTQAYDGVEGVTSAARQAAQATRGEVLMHRDRLVEAAHFASSGGHTASNEDVWGGPPRPYLRGRPDPYDVSPYASWRVSLPSGELLPALSETYGVDVSGLRIGGRSPDGRVATLELTSTERGPLAVRAEDVRQDLNRRFGPETLKSTLFDVERVGEAFVFEGRGLGHGVGLPLWSAREQARQGRSLRRDPRLLLHRRRPRQHRRRPRHAAADPAGGGRRRTSAPP